jgi:hypothetical protein
MTPLDPYHVPEPIVVLLGCNPNLLPGRPEPCPVCRGDVHRPGYYCGQCDRADPHTEARILAARVGLRSRDRATRHEQEARADLKARVRKAELSEAYRRRLWNGYGGFRKARPEGLIGCHVQVIRAWLREIGQEPNWDLILDRRGRVVGRVEEMAEATAG